MNFIKECKKDGTILAEKSFSKDMKANGEWISKEEAKNRYVYQHKKNMFSFKRRLTYKECEENDLWNPQELFDYKENDPC